MEDFLVHVVTWNVGTKQPSPEDDLKPLLGLEPVASAYISIPDLYVVGFQEVKSQPQNRIWDSFFEDPWTAKVCQLLSPFGFVKIQTARLQGLVTSVFVKRTHLIYLRDIETLYTKRGIGGLWGNKGATSIRFGIHGCSVCLINCHLTPHDELNAERIDDYKSILDGQVFSITETSNILFHDYVFWFGDLNFRLEGARTSQDIVEMVSKSDFNSLLQEDQLNLARATGDAFSELQEIPITFPPTYKFEVGFDSYDMKRRPAWTDRILYQVNANVYDNVTLKAEGTNYASHMAQRASDHRPVSASFKIKTFRPTIERLVEFDETLVWRLGESNKVFFKIKPTVDTSPEDWVAIFKADFSSLEQYIGYAYLQSNHTGEGQQAPDAPVESSIVFSDNTISVAGLYVVLYISNTPRSIYGISNVFEAIVA